MVNVGGSEKHTHHLLAWAAPAAERDKGVSGDV